MFFFKCRELRCFSGANVKLWWTRVVLSPFAGKDNGYVYRLLGTNLTKEATISNVGTVTLTEGQWYESDVADDIMVIIEAENPILVMQYIKAGGSSMPRADTSMIIAPSTNMYSRNTIIFPVFDVPITTNYVYKYYIHVTIEYSKVNGLSYIHTLRVHYAHAAANLNSGYSKYTKAARVHYFCTIALRTSRAVLTRA